MASPQLPTFGSLLKRLRRAAQLTQEELAARAGYSASYLSAIERGAREPPPGTVDLLAEILALDPGTRATLVATMRGQRPQRRLADYDHATTSVTGGEGGGHREPGTPGTPGTPGAGRAGSTPPPLVGRAGELARLQRHLQGEGPPLLLVTGEPGIGKTRLLQEISARAQAGGWTVLAGGCRRRSGEEPFAPFAEALAQSLAGRPQHDQRRALHGCAWLVRLVPEMAEGNLVPLPAWPLGPEQERRLMFTAVGRFVANVAGPAGTLLLLDDLHWAGADALDLLLSLVRGAAAADAESKQAVRLLGAYRSTEVQFHGPHPFALALADLAREGLVEEIPLGPLAPEEAHQLLAAMWTQDGETAGESAGDSGQAGPDGDLRAWVLRRAGGVPFFLVSCAQALRVSREQEERAAGAIPWDVAQTVRQRMAALPQQAQEVLAVAAVAGRSVRGEVVLTVAERLGQTRWQALEAAEACCRAGLLIEQAGSDAAGTGTGAGAGAGDSGSGSGSYGFAHDLIHEVVVADVSAGRLAALHQEIAVALERLPGEPPVEQLAYHYARAGVPEKAVVYLAQAGERARRMYAHAEAEQAYQAYVQHLETLGRQAESAYGREQLASVQAVRSRFAAALEVLELALQTYRRVRDAEGQRRVLALVAQIHAGRGTPQHGLAYLLPQLAELGADLRAEPTELPAADATPGLATLEVGLADLFFGTGRYPEQLAAAERAVQLARTVGDERLVLRAYHMYGLALCMLERVEEALAVLEVQYQLAERQGDLDQVAHTLNNRAGLAADRGDFPASLRDINRAVDAAEQVGDPTLLAQVLVTRSQIYFPAGDWRAARADAERAVTLLGPIEQSWARAGALWILGQLALAEGQAQAQDLLEQALTLAQQSGGDLEAQRGAQAALAERDLLQGRPASARARLEPLLDRTAAPERGVTLLLVLLAWAAVDRGEEAQAAALLARSVARAGEDDRLVEVEAYRIQAYLCLRQHRWDAGRAALEHALARCRAMSYPYGEAKARYLYGQLCAAQGEPERACEQYEQALAMCARLGERLYAEQIERALAAEQRSEPSPSTVRRQRARRAVPMRQQRQRRR